jgi:hypothetical protein
MSTNAIAPSDQLLDLRVQRGILSLRETRPQWQDSGPPVIVDHHLMSAAVDRAVDRALRQRRAGPI